jgi:CheY-like chemotaxis protein
MAHILIAEDERSVRVFGCRALQGRGHQVTSAEDGLQALSELAAGEFDLLLSDIVMPGMDGVALAKKACRDNPAMPILLMTGYSAERERAHDIEFLSHEVILKPFTLRNLIDTVDRALSPEG